MRKRSLLSLFSLCSIGVLTLLGCAGGSQSSPSASFRIVAFTAEGCAPCKIELPKVKGLGVRVDVIDMSRQPKIAERWGVNAVPVFFLLRDGRLAARCDTAECVVQSLAHERRR